MVTKLSPHPVKKHKEKVREDFGPPPVFQRFLEGVTLFNHFQSGFGCFLSSPLGF